jgi:RNA polymerase sigma factor for flagellar operon FliA
MPDPLFLEYARTRALALRNRLVEANLPLVAPIAKQLARTLRGVEIDELIADGAIGLMQAVESFDPGRGWKFSSYAWRRIQGAMFDGIRQRDTVPRSARSREQRRQRDLERAAQRTGRRQRGRGLPRMVSLDDCSGRIPGRMDPARLEEREERARLLRGLRHRDQLLVELVDFEGLLMDEVGQMLGISQSRVSQLHKDAIRQLRERFSESPAAEAAAMGEGGHYELAHE